MARSKRTQTTHDAKVRQEASRLEGQGFEVAADIVGFPQPNTIGGYRPMLSPRRATRGRSSKWRRLTPRTAQGTRTNSRRSDGQQIEARTPRSGGPSRMSDPQYALRDQS